MVFPIFEIASVLYHTRQVGYKNMFGVSRGSVVQYKMEIAAENRAHRLLKTTG